MKSKVFFAPVSAADTESSTAMKLEALIRTSPFSATIGSGDDVILKLHFGEQGNKGFVRPAYVARIAQAVRDAKGEPIVSDSNTLYRGRRMNSEDHARLAYEHGFTPDALNARVVIPDDTRPQNVSSISLNGEYVKTARIARLYADAGAIIGIAHFKGHLMTGFGGALKNLGMGCATREGKLFQHSDLAPIVVIKKCAGCKACVAVCPSGAITMKNNRAVVDSAKCIGCASCIPACTFKAIDLDWQGGGMLIQEKMAEYALAVLSGKQGKVFFFNFLIKITKECDCIAKDDPRIVPDIGILASSDPVAADQASYDLVTSGAGTDILSRLHPHRDGAKQLAHAQKIGLGSREYALETIA
ncbi:MAG TPA: DUF362 domain-containing protein [Candidatus Omnitrophota bacterium]|nr:DUF362 domain-containing protein [Candidatus Omnitrophota bacterium]HQQ05535.1 DUF362 domain-containing protein [Candidatus Omnitrophota bacterium]